MGNYKDTDVDCRQISQSDSAQGLMLVLGKAVVMTGAFLSDVLMYS